MVPGDTLYRKRSHAGFPKGTMYSRGDPLKIRAIRALLVRFKYLGSTILLQNNLHGVRVPAMVALMRC